jgi:hypothetical protein
MQPVLSPATVEWMHSALADRTFSTDGGWIPAGDIAWRITADRDDQSVVYLKDRGSPEERFVWGCREYVERWFVWTAASQGPARQAVWGRPQAPSWAIAPGGPLTARRTNDGLVEVVADDAVVLTCHYGDAAVEFTHYGYLPVDLLIQQIEAPPEESVFHLEPVRRRGLHWQRSVQRKNRDAPERIRRWAVEQLARRDEEERRALGAEEDER